LTDPVTLRRLYRSMRRIRRAEEEIARVYPTDKIQSPVHLAIGQEAAPAAVCEALRADDVVFGTYRSHAAYLAKGGELKRLLAELYGKATGCSRGKGGSMHVVDVEHGIMGTSAVVGTTIPHAVGYAYALRLQKRDAVVVSFFGDGAVEEGVFSESLAFATLKKLPVLFVCENNLYAIHSRVADRQPAVEIATRATSLGIPADRVEDGDPLRIYALACASIEAIRSGDGPRFLECVAYRWREHVGPNEDFAHGYRSRDEARPWFDRDPLRKVGALIPAPEVIGIDAAVEAEISEAFAFAEESPFPEPEQLYTDVFKA